ncbi:MAG: SdrD B-like domain-containing protein [Candidatus Eisenbacteria bacterium]
MRGRFRRISPYHGHPGWAKARDRVFWFLVMILALARPPMATSATIQNEASGSFGGLDLGSTYGTVVLNRVGGPVSAATFEVTPSELPLHGRGRSVRLSLLPVLRDGDLGIEVLRVGLGPGLTGVDLTAMVDAQGDTLTAATDPSGVPEDEARYAKEITGENVLQVRFPEPWAASQAALDLYLTVDAVGPAGSVPIEVQLAAGSKTAHAAVGDANGDPTDGDAGEITILSGVDPDRSVVYAEPPVILADDFQEATVVAILLGVDGEPYPGKEVRFESSRPGLETLVQPTEPTDADGRVTARIRSGAVGVSTLTAVDVTDGITLGDRATVAFTQGAVLNIEKSGGADNVTPGDVVTYRIEIDNQTDRAATAVQILDTPPEGFQYLSGSARLDDQRIDDPGLGARLRFAIGDVAPNEVAVMDSLLDLSAADVEASSGILTRASGRSAPARVLTYALVAGANTRPGTYDNTAVAVDACDECEISNRSSASVDVVPDDLFDRSLIVGKVFEDENRNGRQDTSEPGIAGVRVVLDDGSYSVTDPHGRYHLTRVTPGQRLVKIDTGALGDDVQVHEGPTRVLWISPGLLGRANFGVHRTRNQVEIGSPSTHGIEYRAELTARPVEVVGYVTGDQALVNGTAVELTGCDAVPRLTTTSVVNLSSAPVYLVVPFELHAEESRGQTDWSLRIRTIEGTEVGRREGIAPLPRAAEVEIRSDAAVAPEGLQYRLDVRYEDGTVRSTSWRRLGIQLITQAHSLGVAGLSDDVGSGATGARATVAGEEVPLEADGRFQTLWSATEPDLTVQVERSGGSRKATTVPIPGLSLTGVSRSTLGWDDGRVRLAPVPDYVDSASISVVDTLSLRTAPGNRIWVDGEWMSPDADGSLALPVEVSVGRDRVGLFVESPDGFRQIYDLDLGVATADTSGRPFVLAPGVPELSVDLPSSGVLSSPVHLLRGRTAVANRVFLNGLSRSTSRTTGPSRAGSSSRSARASSRWRWRAQMDGADRSPGASR